MVSSSCAPTTTRIRFTRDRNPGLQGESGMCDPPLNPDLHPFGTLWLFKLRPTVSLMARDWRKWILRGGQIKVQRIWGKCWKGIFFCWVTRGRVWHPWTETVCHVQMDACWFTRGDIIWLENMIWGISFLLLQWLNYLLTFAFPVKIRMVVSPLTPDTCFRICVIELFWLKLWE